MEDAEDSFAALDREVIPKCHEGRRPALDPLCLNSRAYVGACQQEGLGRVGPTTDGRRCEGRQTGVSRSVGVRAVAEQDVQHLNMACDGRVVQRQQPLVLCVGVGTLVKQLCDLLRIPTADRIDQVGRLART